METKTVYIFDPETGKFITEYQANPSPREPGKFIEPISSTPIQPPPEQDGFTRHFVDGAWQQIEIPQEIEEEQPA